MNNDVLKALVDALDRRESVALITVTDAEGEFSETIGNHCLLRASASTAVVGHLDLGDLNDRVLKAAADALYARKPRHLDFENEHGHIRVFVDVQAQPPHLIIAGAGHIAVPLASIAHTCDFEVTVLDDRPQYANRARFPSADRVIAGPFRSELVNLRAAHGLDNHSYIVLVTRGHQYDIECLLEVLDDPMAYVGMIGSVRRIRAVFDLLEQEEKLAPEKFDKIYAPIGIDIGARTPAEIAVCIMAEIINVQRGGPADSLSQQIRRERLARRDRALNATQSSHK